MKWVPNLAVVWGLALAAAQADDQDFYAPAEQDSVVFSNQESHAQAPAPPADDAGEIGPVREANAALRAGRPEDAIRLLQPVIEDDPQRTSAWHSLGLAYWKKGDLDRTIKVWRDLARLDTAFPEVHRWLGDVYRGIGRFRQAMVDYAEYFRAYPDSPDAAHAFIRCARWAGDLDAAESAARRCLDRTPSDPVVERELAAILFAGRRYEEAAPLWASIVRKSPGDEQARIREIACRAHLGENPLVRIEAEQFLSQHTNNVDALTLLADLAESQQRFDAAIGYIRRLSERTADPQKRARMTMRVVSLIEAHHGRDPARAPLDDAIRILHDLLAGHADDIDVRLLYGEALMQGGRHDEAREIFRSVLDTENPGNLRAIRGLFELGVVTRDFKAAGTALERMESFNPKDPYLHYYRARMEASRPDYRAALAELDALERAGHRGAVAVLLYHGLSPTDRTPVPSVRLVREQIEAFQSAGYRLVNASKLDAFFLAHSETPGADWRTRTPMKVAAVTFDDARRDALRMGGPLSKETGVIFCMFIPAGYPDREHPFIGGWPELKKSLPDGRWEFGSHSYFAHDPLPAVKNGPAVHPLSNRLWMESQNRQETMMEFERRLDEEYRRSQSRIGEETGVRPPDFLAYPFGDIGQLGASNVSNAPAENLRLARRYYRTGFIQSQFGHAVWGDDPLLYQRAEPKRDETGRELANRLWANHPVLLARRMRAELAALSDRRRLAMDMLDQLKKDGYPEPELARLEDYIHRFVKPSLWSRLFDGSPDADRPEPRDRQAVDRPPVPAPARDQPVPPPAPPSLDARGRTEPGAKKDDDLPRERLSDRIWMEANRL